MSVDPHGDLAEWSTTNVRYVATISVSPAVGRQSISLVSVWGLIGKAGEFQLHERTDGIL